MRIVEKDTLPGVQRLIRQVLDEEGISPIQLSSQSGIHFTTLYGILKRRENQRRRPVHRATIKAIGESLGYEIAFNQERNEIVFSRPDLKPTRNSDVEELLCQLRSSILQSGRKEFDKKEMERIVNVVRAMVA